MKFEKRNKKISKTLLYVLGVQTSTVSLCLYFLFDACCRYLSMCNLLFLDSTVWT